MGQGRTVARLREIEEATRDGAGQRSIHRVDVDAAIPFYTEMLGFRVDMHPAPGFASLQGDLHLLLNRPARAARDSRCPTAKRPLPADGTGSRSSRRPSHHRREAQGPRDSAFAMRCDGNEENRSSWTIHPGNPIELFQPARD